MTLHVTMEVPADPAALTAVLEGLVRLNEYQLAQAVLGGGEHPPLYASRVVYRREPPGEEDWKTIDRLFTEGEGDCEDLATARAAQLRREGEQASAIVVPTRGGKFHAMVLREMGDLEDPSRVLLATEATNMPKAKTKICIKNVGTHCMGSIEIPMSGGQKLSAHELGWDPWQALHKVIGAVLEVASNPVVASMLPPQAAIALQVAARIADMSPQGLQKLIGDDRTTDAQRKLASKVLVAKQASGQGSTQADVGWGLTDILKAGATALNPAAGLTWIAADAAKQAMQPRQARQPIVVQRDRSQGRSAQMNPAVPPGYPPGYPPPGYPPGYPPQGYPMPPMYGYPPAPMAPMPYIDPAEMAQFMAAQQQPQGMMSPEEAAAIMLWGAQSFAPGSFPGFDESGQGAPPQWGGGWGY